MHLLVPLLSVSPMYKDTQLTIISPLSPKSSLYPMPLCLCIWLGFSLARKNNNNVQMRAKTWSLSTTNCSVILAPSRRTCAADSTEVYFPICPTHPSASRH